MLKLGFQDDQPSKILCLGAHCDDIEIGAGGSLLQLFKNGIKPEVKWVVFTSNETRKKEAENAANQFLQGIDAKDIVVESFPDGFLPYAGKEVKNYFEKIKKEFDPDLIFTHTGKDAHQDHRKINELTWNTFRNHLILEYEIPKYDGDLGQPNCFIPLDREIADQKCRIILDSYPSQSGKHWFEKETFTSIMRLRGMESASKSGYAEAFHLRKAIIQ